MNVSMMDSYNLSWKLMHSLNGLTPPPIDSSDKVLDTYQTERLTVAQQLIQFDKEFSSMFSGKIGTGDGKEGLTHEQFLEVFSTGNGFTSGCGIEYPENLLVEKKSSEEVVSGTDFLSGVFRPGRRLLNVKAKRHADGYRRDLQDGKYSPISFMYALTDNAQTFRPQADSVSYASHLLIS
jgi:phenol 2-monooxygenase